MPPLASIDDFAAKYSTCTCSDGKCAVAFSNAANIGNGPQQ